MAAGMLPTPGTEYGPCKDHCNHRDCAETRRMAAAICRLCSRPIGYSRRFYREEHDFVHAACLEEALEREFAAREVSHG